MEEKKYLYSVGCFEKTEALGVKSTAKYQILSSLLQCLPHICAASLYCLHRLRSSQNYHSSICCSHLPAGGLVFFGRSFLVLLFLLKTFPTNLMPSQVPFLFLRLHFLSLRHQYLLGFPSQRQSQALTGASLLFFTFYRFISCSYPATNYFLPAFSIIALFCLSPLYY